MSRPGFSIVASDLFTFPYPHRGYRVRTPSQASPQNLDWRMPLTAVKWVLCSDTFEDVEIEPCYPIPQPASVQGFPVLVSSHMSKAAYTLLVDAGLNSPLSAPTSGHEHAKSY